jgi:hypothetical protein
MTLAPTDRLSDTLHRGLATSGLPTAGCWLLLDPSPLGLQDADEPALAELFAHRALLRVKPSRAGVPVEIAPALLHLDAAVPADSALIRSSVELALQELPSPRLAQGGGRVIVGWVECDGEVQAAQAELRRHFAQTMFAHRGPGRTDWLRWYDPAVLWALWPRLSTAQQRMLLGPIARFWLFTPSAELLCLTTAAASPQATAEPTAAATQAVEFTTSQWLVIDAIGALNLALVQIHASELDVVALEQARDVGMSALTRAQQAGFADRRDLALYARTAITCHAHFDRHPTVAERLQTAQPGEFFAALIDGITDAQWRQIAQDLNEGRALAATS